MFDRDMFCYRGNKMNANVGLLSDIDEHDRLAAEQQLST